jgi:hypothetical protein
MNNDSQTARVGGEFTMIASGLSGSGGINMNLEYSFGRIIVDGQTCNSDIKIVSGKLVPNWWRNSGHTVEVEDVQDVIDSNSTILVIGKGQPGYMKVTESLRKRLEKNDIELIVEQTSDAIQTFNRLIQAGKQVSAGFHVGC